MDANDPMLQAMQQELQERTNGASMTTVAAGPSIGLDKISRGVVKKPTRLFIYGTDGIGKTTFAGEAPGAIIVPTEDGAMGVDVAKFPVCKSWEVMISCLWTLYKEQHEFKTVILDSADWAQRLAVAHVLATEYKGDQGAFDDYGKGYKVVLKEWGRLLMAMDRLRDERGMSIILIGHVIVRTVKNPNGGDYDKFQANLNDGQNTSIWNLTKEWADLVAYCAYDMSIQAAKQKDRPGKALIKNSKDGSRLMHFKPGGAYDAKVRAGWKFPDKIPLTYEAFAKCLAGEVVEEPQTEEVQA